MSALSDAVKNGPRATAAKTAHIEARIKLADAKASALQQAANNHARKAKGDGPMAKYHRGQAAALASAADRRRAEANDLRVNLAKAKADEAARNVKHVKRTVASTAAEGLVPKIPSQGGPAKAGQDKRGGQPVAKPRKNPPREVTPHPKVRPETHGVLCPCCGGHHGPDYKPAKGEHCGWCHGHGRGGGANFVLAPSKDVPPRQQAIKEFNQASNGRDLSHIAPGGILLPTKGTPAMTVSGEAVNIEQTRANLDQLKGQVSDLRGSFEGISGSLASGGLNQLAGSLASADDSLDSVLTQIAAAEKHLSDQEAIAEAAQAAGEMHTDTAFYG